MNTLKEQLYYVVQATNELTERAMTLDGKAKAKLMRDADSRYHSTELEGAARRLYGELDELGKAIEAEAKKLATIEDELADKNLQI